MDVCGFLKRRGFWLLALLWLPVGVLAQAAFRFTLGEASGPDPDMGLMMMVMVVPSLIIVAPCGLPLALCCRRLWWLGYCRTAWVAAIGLGTVMIAASVLAGLLGTIAIAIYAAVLSAPVWIAALWLAWMALKATGGGPAAQHDSGLGPRLRRVLRLTMM